MPKRSPCPSGILCIGLVFPESLNKEFVVGKIEKERYISQWGKVASEAETQCSFFLPCSKKQWVTQGKWWKHGHSSYQNTNNILPFCITHLLDDSCFSSCCQSSLCAEGHTNSLHEAVYKIVRMKFLLTSQFFIWYLSKVFATRDLQHNAMQEWLSPLSVPSNVTSMLVFSA